MPVANVQTRDTGRDVTPLINELAGDQADVLLALCIAESGLDEHSWRDTKYSDRSGGLTHVRAVNLGYADTPVMTASYRLYMWDAANALTEGWRWLRAMLVKHTDPLLALVAYNVGTSLTSDQVRALIAAGDPKAMRAVHHYSAAMKRAEAYRVPDQPTPEPTPEEEPTMPDPTTEQAPATVEERLDQLDAQQAKTVTVLREALKGDWEAARIWLDAIDPANAGTWTNAPFPPKD